MKLQVILTTSIFLTALIGDYIVFKSNFSQSQVFRACSDSVVHATLGFLSAVLFLSRENLMSASCIFNLTFCTFISSLIDVDHIFVARSLQWKDITNLKQRGIFHCTTFWLTLTSVLLTYSYYYKKHNIHLMTWMLVLAYTSHHVRDANRRGLWMYPFGHTRALPKLLYVTIKTFGLIQLTLSAADVLCRFTCDVFTRGFERGRHYKGRWQGLWSGRRPSPT